MEVIYILHGWSTDANNYEKWQKFLGLLNRQGFNTKFIAIPGLDTNLEISWSLDDYVSWLAGHVKDSKFILLGHSFGGQIGCRFAARFPDRVTRLILVDSAGLRDNRLRKVIKRRLFKTVATWGKALTKSLSLKKLLYKLAREQDYLQASEVMKQTMANVINDEVKNDLSQITCPTLIIWGQGDATTPRFQSQIFKSLISGSRLKIVAGARHSPQFTHVEDVVKEITGFVKRS